MKKLSDKNKRWLTVAGLGVVCIALVIAISSQFKTEVPKDNLNAPSPTASGEVNPSSDAGSPAGGKDVVVQANEPATASTETSNTADSTGTEQTIQLDSVKPEAPTSTPTPQGDTTDSSKTPTYKSEDTTVSEPAEPKGGEKKDGKVYLPGFGWVTDTGGSGTTVDGGGDINKQVGQMN